MGNKKSKKKIINDKIENLLTQTYKNTGIDFTENEIVNFKLRIYDSEKYFFSNFDYFIFFNNYLFKEQLAILYDNFNHIIEKASHGKSLTLLIDFDDESDYLNQGSNIEFDSLFTIIFERLEIPTLIYFDMTNVDNYYVGDFFRQIIESVELYKYNRKFDCLYFLLPNTDYILKNENSLFYLSNKTLKNKVNYYSDGIYEIVNDYTEAIFLNQELEKFINCTYPKNISNQNFEKFLTEIKPIYIKTFIMFDLECDIDSLEYLNKDNFIKLKFILNLGIINCLVIFFNFKLDSSNLEIFENKILKNIHYILRKILFYFYECKIEESVLGIKFNLKIKTEEEMADLNQLSSRTYNFNNNYGNNSARECKSARDLKSKREKEKILNYFYDSSLKNIFEILTFDFTTIINNNLNFPQFKRNRSKKNKKISRKINIEFNELSCINKNIPEVVKYSSDSMDGQTKIVKLDYNLHSEKLFLFWENTENDQEEFNRNKIRNSEFNNLRNIINNHSKFKKLNQWNILITIQNMYLEDNIRKNYKIEKSNINLEDYLAKIH